MLAGAHKLSLKRGNLHAGGCDARQLPLITEEERKRRRGESLHDRDGAAGLTRGPATTLETRGTSPSEAQTKPHAHFLMSGRCSFSVRGAFRGGDGSPGTPGRVSGASRICVMSGRGKERGEGGGRQGETSRAA